MLRALCYSRSLLSKLAYSLFDNLLVSSFHEALSWPFLKYSIVKHGLSLLKHMLQGFVSFLLVCGNY